jgi:hypothetical protein
MPSHTVNESALDTQLNRESWRDLLGGSITTDSRVGKDAVTQRKDGKYLLHACVLLGCE